MAQDLTILVSRRAQLNALRHLTRDLRAAAPTLGLHCACPAELMPEVVAALDPGVAVAQLPRGPLLNLKRRLHTFLFMLLAAEDFSPFFRRRVRSAFGGKTARSLLLRLGRRLTPKLGGAALNRFVSAALSAVSWRRTFPTRRVLVLTKCSVPHLLCTRRHDVVSLLDGWDHPTTSPVGYRSRVVASWNADLATDWRRYQGAERYVEGYPYRFAYVLRNRRPATPPAAGSPPDRIKLLYAMATFPSHSPLDEQRHEEEKKLVARLHDWLLPHVASFEVKPHPIGPAGHLDSVAAACPGLVVHAYEASGAANYDLTESYNRQRLATLDATDLVLGIWTTFILDAAMAGKAIALIDLPGEQPFPALWSAQLGLHVHHLRERVGAVISLEPGGPAFRGGDPSFAAFLKEAMDSSRRVAGWVTPAATPRELTRALLADPT